MTYSSEVTTVSWFQLSTNIAIKKNRRCDWMQTSLVLIVNTVKSSLGVCGTLPDCVCSSSRCFVLTSPDKNIGKRHCSAFPSVARLRAFSQAAERPGNFLETWAIYSAHHFFILLDLFRQSFSSSYGRVKFWTNFKSGHIKRTRTKRSNI